MKYGMKGEKQIHGHSDFKSAQSSFSQDSHKHHQNIMGHEKQSQKVHRDGIRETH